MNDYVYKGPFALYLKEHVALKKSIGYKYEAEELHLRRFDDFTLKKYPNTILLTKEIVLEWCKKKSYEAQANQCSRASIIRQFAVYLCNLGIDAYVIPKAYYPTEEQYIPYIYSREELIRFFGRTDKCHYVSECPCRHYIMPVYFRMLYSCGLRLSEARLLKVVDVDLEKGIITIHQSKNDTSRLVPMSADITNRSRIYFNQVHLYSKADDYFFPGMDRKPMTIQNIYHNFRRFLWRAGISHGGRGKGPRIHDFRHSYACHCLKKWVIEGRDLSVYLPVLKTYMGHDSFEETAYYLRMTADVYPDITIKLEGCYPKIIPDLEGGTYETY